MTTHIMLDLETWGTEPGCDIRSIGACVFDPVAGTVVERLKGHNTPEGDGTFYIACDNPPTIDGEDDRYLTYPLHRDPRTVQWWSEQSDEAQAAFADPVDLREALVRFTDWLDDVLLPPARPDGRIEWIDALMPWEYTTLRLWSHGAHFDSPILAAAYRAVGLPVPWHYRAPRDTRTAFDMAGIDDHSAWLKQHPGPLGIPHHALDDAICQARAVCGAYQRVQSPDREFHVGRVAMQRYADWTNQNIDIGGAWAAIERAITEGAS